MDSSCVNSYHIRGLIQNHLKSLAGFQLTLTGFKSVPWTAVSDRATVKQLTVSY